MTTEQTNAMLHAIADITEEYGVFLYDDVITNEELNLILNDYA